MSSRVAAASCVPCRGRRRSCCAAQAPHGRQQPTFRAGTRLIVQTVTVKDKDGKPIEGLTANDFVVTEDGEPQDDRVRRVPAAASTRTRRPRLPRRPPRAPAARSAPAARGAPASAHDRRADFVARRPATSAISNRRLLVLYFDLSAMPPPDQMRAYANAAEVRRHADGPVGSGGDHDVPGRRRPGQAGLHRRPRPAAGRHSDAHLRRRPGRRRRFPTTRTRARPSARTTPSSTSSTPTASCRRCRRRSRCCGRCPSRRRWSTSPAACA